MYKDAQGRYNPRGVDMMIGCPPGIDTLALIANHPEMKLFADCLQIANLSPAGARRVIHHALSDEMGFGGGFSFADLLTGASKVFGVAGALAPNIGSQYEKMRQSAFMGKGWSLGKIWHSIKTGAKKAARVVHSGIKHVIKHKDSIDNFLSTVPGKRAEKLRKGFAVGTQHAADLGDLLAQFDHTDDDRQALAAAHRHPEGIAPRYDDVVHERPSYDDIAREHEVADAEAPPAYSAAGVLLRRRLAGQARPLRRRVR